MLLLRERPRVVAKRDLLARIWPGTHVVEANLNGLIGELRRALGDHPKEPAFIRTVHGTGFAFAAEAIDVATSSSAKTPPLLRCWLMWNERRFVLAGGLNLVGRDPRCEFGSMPRACRASTPGLSVDGAPRPGDHRGRGQHQRDFCREEASHGSDRARRRRQSIEIGSVELTFRTWTGEKQAETERVTRVGK